ISVNMLSRRVLSEIHPRWKSGRPAQTTTGVASANSIHASQLPKACCTGMPGIRSLMARRKTGTLKTRLTRKRRVMSVSSGLLSSALRETGSSAMPQIGQSPGVCDRTSGCMGHVLLAGPLCRRGLSRLEIPLRVRLELRPAVGVAEAVEVAVVEGGAALRLRE